MPKSKSFHFEESIRELESLVADLEKGELPLEDSLKTFEKGIKLARNLQQHLDAAEQKVNKLVESQGDLSLVDFSGHDADG